MYRKSVMEFCYFLLAEWLNAYPCLIFAQKPKSTQTINVDNFKCFGY